MNWLRRLFTRATKISGSPRDPAIAEMWARYASTAAGIHVTAESAMRISAVFACVTLLADTCAWLPIHLYRRRADGGKERADDHVAAAVLKRPNRWQTAFEFRQMLTAHVSFRGAAYARIIPDARGVISLLPLHPDRVRAFVVDAPDGAIAYEYAGDSGKREILLQDEVLRLAFLYDAIDGGTLRPITPIRAQAETFGGALAAQEYGNRFWANDATPRVWLEHPGHFRDAETREEWRKRFREAIGGENRGRIPVLEAGQKLHEISMSNEDAQFLEARKFSVTDIARIWRVPPHMIGDHEKGATYASVEQQAIDFVTHTMAPWFARWQEALARALLSDADTDTYFFEYLPEALLRGDLLSRYRAYAVGRQWGWLSANDVRDRENLNRIEAGDTYLTPLNMIDALDDEVRVDGEQRTDERTGNHRAAALRRIG